MTFPLSKLLDGKQMHRSIGSRAVTGSGSVGRVIDVIVMRCADKLKWRVEISIKGQYFSISRAKLTEVSELEAHLSDLVQTGS